MSKEEKKIHFDVMDFSECHSKVIGVFWGLGNKELKPQDSFGEFEKNKFSSESAGNHQKTPSDLPAIVLNDKL